MCLAIPMKIVEIRADGTGVVDLDGSRRDANLSLVSAPRLGDYVIVHAGFAIEKLDEKEADEQLALFAELAEAGGQRSVPPAVGRMEPRSKTRFQVSGFGCQEQQVKHQCVVSPET